MMFKNLGFNPSDPEDINVERRNVGEIIIDGKSFPWTDLKLEGKAVYKSEAKEYVATRYWNNPDQKPDPDQLITTNFDAFPILLILSQPGCAGIRFYEARKKDGLKTVRTLVMVGIDIKGHDLGFSEKEIKDLEDIGKKACVICDSAEKERSVIIEVGGGNELSDFI